MISPGLGSSATGRTAARRRALGVALPAALFASALLLYGTRLEVPPQYVFDEVYHAYTAAQYVRGNRQAYLWGGQLRAPFHGVAHTWNHPPAGLLLIAGSILAWGDTPFGWRFASAVFGAAGIVLAYALALALTRRRLVAGLAAGFLLADGLYFVQSRTGMLDVFGTVFMLGAFLALHAYLVTPPGRVRGPLLAVGACLGLAVATKWSAAYPAALIGLLALGRIRLLWQSGRRATLSPEAREGLGAHLVWVPVGLGLVPLAVYLAAYLPFFLTGHDLGQFLELQWRAFFFHVGHRVPHPYQSSWWQWPLVLRPVWYHVTYHPNGFSLIYALGNPLLHWAFLPAALWTTWRFQRARDPALAVLVIGFFGQWLPWALVPRGSFLYHFLPAATMGALAVAVVVADLAERAPYARLVATGYVTAVAWSFVYFYPLYAAVPLTPEAFQLRLWLPSWR